MRSQLPPLDTLITFEAAARLLSFTAAARELNLSQAAVSQQIRNLENRLGVKLFDRAHRAVSLTTPGREYQHTVAQTLRQLASATGDIKLSETRPRLTIAADQSVAALCLMPRLGRFQERHPELILRLIASDNDAECLSGDVNVAIIHGTGDWRGYKSQRLFDEEVFPVCSPDYLRRCGLIATPAELIENELLKLDDDHWDWMNWRIWLSRKGIDLPFGHRSFEINNYPLLIEAAKNGQGIALGWRYLVDAELASGRLVKPLDQSVLTEFAYYAVWPDAYERSSDAVDFCNWIASELSPR